MEPRALLMSDADDVVTVLAAVQAGQTVRVETKAGKAVGELVSNEDVPRFHKIARHDIAAHDEVRKYGYVIGEATADIKQGDYVHTHNVNSLRTGVRA